MKSNTFLNNFKNFYVKQKIQIKKRNVKSSNIWRMKERKNEETNVEFKETEKNCIR